MIEKIVQTAKQAVNAPVLVQSAPEAPSAGCIMTLIMTIQSLAQYS